jgi:choline-sulfatase
MQMDGRILDPFSPQVKPPLPNLEKLALAGAKFTTAYNQSPQCVPSRSAMMVGLRTDQVGVWDNDNGIASVNGDITQIDPHCVKQRKSKAVCLATAKLQNAPKTFIDRLADAGYNNSLFGKMHAGAGLSRFNGELQEFPFNDGQKDWRQNMRGVGPSLDLKGLKAGNKSTAHKFVVPDNVTKPALPQDYETVDSCVALLDAGLFRDGSQFLYCSIIVPHPPYQSNATYMAAVAKMNITVPEWVPFGELHPNDLATMALRNCLDVDDVPHEHIIHFRTVYFSMCYEADDLLGRIIDALDNSGAGVRANTYVMMVSDHGENAVEHRLAGRGYSTHHRTPYTIHHKPSCTSH